MAKNGPVFRVYSIFFNNFASIMSSCSIMKATLKMWFHNVVHKASWSSQKWLLGTWGCFAVGRDDQRVLEQRLNLSYSILKWLLVPIFVHREEKRRWLIAYWKIWRNVLCVSSGNSLELLPDLTSLIASTYTTLCLLSWQVTIQSWHSWTVIVTMFYPVKITPSLSSYFLNWNWKKVTFGQSRTDLKKT